MLAYYKKSFSESRGMREATFTMPDGSKGGGRSRWLKIWMKVADGTWKGRINSWKAED